MPTTKWDMARHTQSSFCIFTHTMSQIPYMAHRQDFTYQWISLSAWHSGDSGSLGLSSWNGDLNTYLSSDIFSFQKYLHWKKVYCEEYMSNNERTPHKFLAVWILSIFWDTILFILKIQRISYFHSFWYILYVCK